MRDFFVFATIAAVVCTGCSHLDGVEKGRDVPVELETVQIAGRGISPPVVVVEQGVLTVRGVLGAPQAGYALFARAEVEPGNRCVLTITAKVVSGGMTVPVGLSYTARLIDLPAQSFDLVVRHEWADRPSLNVTALTWPVTVTTK